MVQDEKKYHIVKERQSEDVVVVTYTRKERRCDGCLCNKKGKEIRIVNYPIIHKICDDCYDDYREIVDNLKYN